MNPPADDHDRDLDEREVELERREAVLAAREDAFQRRMEAATDILAAAEQRDTDADVRDTRADVREAETDKAAFAASEKSVYGEDWPDRRAAAIGREHAKGDRAASHDDRVALTEDKDGPQN